MGRYRVWRLDEKWEESEEGADEVSDLVTSPSAAACRYAETYWHDWEWESEVTIYVRDEAGELWMFRVVTNAVPYSRAYCEGKVTNE